MWAVFVTSVILQCFGEVDAHSVSLVPSPTAHMTEGDALILNCSCSGSKHPDYINWYLNNDTSGLVIDASSCRYQTRPEQYDIDRYSTSCNETKFYLTIANISKEKDDKVTWKCDNTVFGMDPPKKALTIISVIDADAHSVSLVPSPIAQVVEGNTLSLHCSYNGPITPDYINWYLNNDTFGLVIETSSCRFVVTPKQYEMDRYNISCHETKFSLSIANISKDKDHQDTWQCDTTVIGMRPSQKGSTRIVVIDAGKNGQSDEPKTEVLARTVVDTGMVVGVTFAVVIAVVIAVVVCFLYRKRRNDHLKNEIEKDHVKDHEQMGNLLEIEHEQIDCNQA